jgi:hypothetical protein
VLFLLERKSSSLTSLFEDDQELEENICASRRTREQADFENPHLPEPTKCRYGSDFEHEGYQCEIELEQQQACEFISESDLDSLILAEFSRDRYESEVYDQFTNQIEPMIINDENHKLNLVCKLIINFRFIPVSGELCQY